MKVVKWANSLAVRLPASLVERLQLSAGAHVGLRAKLDETRMGARQPSGFGEEPNDHIRPHAADHSVTVGKWGNGLAVRLPRDLVASLGLAEGDEVMIENGGADMLLITKELSIDELFHRVRSLRGLIPADFKFDREEANARVPHERD